MARILLKHNARYEVEESVAAGELCEYARQGKLEHVQMLIQAG